MIAMYPASTNIVILKQKSMSSKTGGVTEGGGMNPTLNELSIQCCKAGKGGKGFADGMKGGFPGKDAWGKGRVSMGDAGGLPNGGMAPTVQRPDVILPPEGLEHTFFQTDFHKICSKISAFFSHSSEIWQSWHHSSQNH